MNELVRLGVDTIHGDADNDQLHGGDGEGWVYGDAGIDWVYGGRDTDRVYGNAGDDVICENQQDSGTPGGGAASVARNRISGGGGTDVLRLASWFYADPATLFLGDTTIERGYYNTQVTGTWMLDPAVGVRVGNFSSTTPECVSLTDLFGL